MSISPLTGIISGITPSTPGDYVVAVCALEFRGGILIGSTKKEIHITVGDCSLKAAELKPAYINCNNLTFNFFNESNNPNIVSYLWIFGDSLSSPVLDTSLSATPTHVYSDTGIYRISLTVQSLGGCVDSAKSLVRVYPGFKANFVWKGTCLKNPYYFIDSSYSQYGKVNNWNWNLGEPAASDDTIQDPSYTYQSTGQKTVTLKVSNTNGCEDSTTQVITILENPKIVLPFDSTLICNIDTIQLSASEQNSIGNANFKWTSIDSLSIINPNSANPFVDPKDTAIYYVSLSDSGCFAMDSVIVNTVPKITVKAGPDSSICQTDSIKLYALTQGTTIGWTSSTAGEKVDSVFTPWVRPLVNPTNYYVVANLHDKCFAWDTITINVYPYPIASGADDSVCFGGSIQLNASISNNAFFYWSPTYSLLDSSSLYPIASPDSTTHYVLTAYYKGTDVCPKLVTDTITIRVIPKVIVDLGDDTTVVVHEPLHLFVKGNTDSTTASYLWYTPNGSATFLDDNHSQDPTAIFQDGTDSITYIVNATLKNPKACSAQDTIKIIIFQTPPEVFVPSAFTPDANINKTIRPIPVGILQLDYFSIYNRFGQLLFTTSQIGVGWDGTYKGVPQPPGTYVYTVQAESYLRRPLPGKGTIVLIR